MLFAFAGYSFGQTTVPQWTKENVLGLNLSLNDPTHVEELQFAANGDAVAMLAIKDVFNSSDCPDLKWRITNNKLRMTIF